MTCRRCASNVGNTTRIDCNAPRYSVDKIVFINGNLLNIAESSRVKMRAFDLIVPDNSTSTVDLIFGKVRAKVVTKSKSFERPSFKIRTPAAVAGVRGTEFVMTHPQGGDITKLETLDGTVELKGHTGEEKALIKKGEYASFVLLASNQADSKVFKDDDIGSFVQRGFITPVYKMSDAQKEKLNIETDYRDDGSDRIVATKGNESICHEPMGDLNQCAWICKNNPSGEKSCRTDLGASCVRRRCNANGDWSEEKRLPSSQGEGRCTSATPVVNRCDY